MRKFVVGTLMTLAILESAIGVATADGRNEFGEWIAGTYLANTADDALILQLGTDGSTTVILSEQFSGGVVGEFFSDTLGQWKRVGRRTIVVHSVDVAIDNSEFFGIAAAKYVIHFDRRFRRAKLNCTGAIYPPGVDPFSPDAEPIDETEFDCTDYSLKRLP